MATNTSDYAHLRGQSSLSPPLPPRPSVAPTSSQTHPQPVKPPAQSFVSPPLPSRPSSTHSDNYFQCASPSGVSPVSSPSSQSPQAGSTPTSPDAEQKSNWGKRFAGNMLIGRGLRASTTSITSSAKLPINLSPWGDNNPVTFPNIRTRDVFFAGASHFGGDVIVQGLGEVMTFSGSLLQEAISTFMEAAIEATILDPKDKRKAEKLLDEKCLDRVSTEEHVILQTTSVKSIKISIEHQLMGVDADLRFFQTRPCPVFQRGSCAKGWFCPYLYASGRRPTISRADDFAIAQCDGPALEGKRSELLVNPSTIHYIIRLLLIEMSADSKLAHKLLAESAATMWLCDPRPSINLSSHRMVILFAGISPWRMQAWSQSRIPDGARLIFQMINGCPALVIPVTTQAPILAWSPWTLRQMHDKKFNPSEQYAEIFRYLDSIMNLQAVDQPKKECHKIFMAKGIKMIIKGAIEAKEVENWEMIEPERAGIIMFRY